MVTRVRVEFIGQLRELTGAKEITIAVEGRATLDSAMKTLTDKFGGALRERIFEEGKLSDELLLILNGRSVRPADLTSVGLKDGDNIVLAPESAP
jgi:MoaD family protein